MRIEVTSRQGRQVIKRATLELEKLEAVAMNQNVSASILMANRALLSQGKTAKLKLLLTDGKTIISNTLKPIYERG